MRVAGQQRRAGRGVSPIDRPFVRGAVRAACRARESPAARMPGARRPRRTGSMAGSSRPGTAVRAGAAKADRASQPARGRPGPAGPVPGASSSTATGPSSSPRAGCRPAPTVPAGPAPGIPGRRSGPSDRSRRSRPARRPPAWRAFRRASAAKSATARCRRPSVRIIRSIGSVAGPAISDSRPEAARRISSIWNMRSRACRKPSAVAASCSDCGVDARHPVGVVGDVDRTRQAGDRGCLLSARHGQPQRADDQRHEQQDKNADRCQHAGDASEEGSHGAQSDRTGRRWEEAKW